MRKLSVVLCLFIASLLPAGAADYYWVNGSGYWTDINHWATTSGGSVLYSQVPGPADNVFFDDNSFSTNDSVTITGDIFLRKLSSINLSKKAYMVGEAGYTANIYGGIDLGDSLSLEKFPVQWKFVAITGSHDIRSRIGIVRVDFDGTGSWNIKDSFNTSTLNLYSGTLNLDTSFVDVHSFNFYGTSTKNINYRHTTVACGDFNVHAGTSVSSTDSKLMVKGNVRNYQSLPVEIPDTYMEANLPHTITGNLSTRKLVLENSPVNLLRSFTGTGLIVDTIFLKGKNIIKLTGPPYELAIKGTIINNSNNCSDRSAFIADNVTNGAVINNLSGTTITTSNLVMNGINSTGTTALLCQNCVNAGNNNNIAFQNPALGRAYYWIGGKGEWQDPGHWSLNSGGVAVNCIPGMVDTIIFDNNSGFFLNDSVKVTADFISGSWINNCSTAFVIGGSSRGTIRGSFVFNYPLGGLHLSQLFFKGDSGVHQIKSSGTVFSCNLSFDGYKAAYYLQDSITTNRQIEITGAEFYSQGHQVSAEQFVLRSNWKKADITGSTFYIGSFTVEPKGTGSILNMANTHIFFRRGFSSSNNNAYSFWHLEKVTPGSGGSVYLGNNNCHFLKIFGQIDFSGSSELDTLIIEKNSTVNFDIIGSVVVKSLFTANGDCNNWIHLYSDYGNQNITVSSGAQVVMNYCMVSRVEVIGVSAYQSNSICLFDCNGNYSPPAGRTLYWVGGTGNWSDLSRWSYSSRGAPGISCLPGPSDTIIFDHNSVNTNDTVWYDVSLGACASIRFQTANYFMLRAISLPSKLVVTNQVLVNSNLRASIIELFLASKVPDAVFEGIWDGQTLMNIKVEGIGKWTFKGKLHVSNSGRMEIWSGDVLFDSFDLKLSDLEIGNYYFKPSNVTFNHSIIQVNSYGFNGGNVYPNSSSISFIRQFYSNNYNSAVYSRVLGKAASGGYANSIFQSNTGNKFLYLELDGSYTLNDDFNADTLVIYPGSFIRRSSNTTGTINKFFKAVGLACNFITIQSTQTGNKSNWLLDSAVILADFVRMRDQNALNPGTFYIGKNSQDIDNNAGWIFGNNKGLIYGLGEDTAICGSQALELNSPNNYLGATYLWNTGEKSSSILVDTVGTYWLQAYYDESCIMRDTIRVRAITLPNNLLVSDTILCGFDSVAVYAPKSDSLNYEWDNLSRDTIHYISSPGTYRLRTYVPGCERLDSFRIVSQAIEAISNFPLGDTAVCIGFSWTADVQANKADSILWSTGQNGSSIQIVDTGMYWYRAKNNYCESTDTVILILSEPFVEAPSDTAICSGSGVKLFPLASKGDVSWESFGAGDTILVNAAGLYITKATIGSCSMSDSVTVSLIEPELDLGPADIGICLGQNLKLFPVSKEGSISWTGFGAVDTVVVSSPGIYRAQSSIGACMVSDSIEVKFALKDSPLDNQYVLCTDDSAQVTIIGSYDRFSWYDGDTVSLTKYFTSPGLYHLMFEKSGCSAADTFLVNENILAELKYNDTAFCGSFNLQRSVDANQFPVVNWAQFGNSHTVNITSPGIYRYSYSDGFCTSSDSFTIDNKPLPPFNPAIDTVFCDITSYRVDYSFIDSVDFIWSDGRTDMPRTFDEPGVYSFTVNRDNCKEEVLVNLTPCPCEVFIPNSFTPSDDLLNDVFAPVLCAYLEYEFKIFNRWGELIFQSNKAEIGWDGNYKGVPCEEEAYLWMISMLDGQGELVIKKGMVILLRP